MADACNAVGDGYACEAFAIFKRRPTDDCNAVRDGDACEAAATVKCIIIDACYAVRNGIRSICLTFRISYQFGLNFVEKNSVHARICRIGCINIYLIQFAATVKRIRADACYAVGNGI